MSVLNKTCNINNNTTKGGGDSRWTCEGVDTCGYFVYTFGWVNGRRTLNEV